MTDGWPELLLALAGRIPDDVVAVVRGQALALDPTERVNRIVAGAQQVGARLLASDLLALLEALVLVAEPGDAESAAMILDARGDLPGTAYRFEPLRPTMNTDAPAGRVTGVDLSRSDHRNWIDPVARSAVDFAATQAGITALWGVRRKPFAASGFGKQSAARVFLIDVETDTDPARITMVIQDHLIAAGESVPRVEVLNPTTRPAPYQRAGLAAAALLWAPPSTPAELVAAFDGLDDRNVPWFDPAHSRLPVPEQARVAAYLYGAEPLLLTTATMPDVVDPGSGMVVPLNFRTDGAHIWPEAVAYYADRHGLAPRGALLAAIRSAGYRPPVLNRGDRFRAERVLFGEA